MAAKILPVTEFEKRYQHLNAQQKQAVDTLDGPVMVVAGPGTGKTELLSVRAANILNKTDVNPHNILCLTYTESGASAMRERLAQLIGPDAYKVSVHTFHSFGSEIINRYSEYFYHGAHFRPSDELSTYEVLSEIFDKLPHDSPLASKMNDQFTHLGDTQVAISELKKSGLTPDELLQILDRNDAFIEWLKPRLESAFGARMSKKQFGAIEDLILEISKYQEQPLKLINYQPLWQQTHDSLKRALDHATANSSTAPLSEWKRQWITKHDDGSLTLKDAKRDHKLRAVASVYYDYLRAMQDRSLFDFDDMILRVVHGMEVFNELCYELQEQYLYVMVDEFQDTNDAQMRLIWNLTNAPTNEGRPNLMIVGDDDQAIYRFQGATLSNILDFDKLYRDVVIIPLKDNYRSDSKILELSRSVIKQADERLESVIKDLDKTLTPHHKAELPDIDYCTYTTPQHEYVAVAETLAEQLKQNQERSRAIIARRHRQLQEILPYLHAAGIPLIYDRQEDILETEPIKQLELVGRVIDLLVMQRLSDADVLMPQLLAHEAWGINPKDLWQLSIEANRRSASWLEVMLERNDRLNDIANWIVATAQKAQNAGLEPMIDWLFGTEEPQVSDTAQDDVSEPFSDGPKETFISPLRAYFFPTDSLQDTPGKYLAHLSALRTLRQRIREYRPDTSLKLHDLITFIDTHRELNLPIQGVRRVGENSNAVELLTAHRAKGLEFDDVFVIGLTDANWGETARTRARLVAFPHNLPLGFDTDTTDEKLRLLYVALTRAKEQLHLSTHRSLDNGKTMLPIGYLQTGTLSPVEQTDPSLDIDINIAQIDWRAPYYSLEHGTMHELLSPVLDRYRLSSTHLNNYLDVSRGGPELFLLQNLLRFPQAMSPSAAFGSAIHSALQRAHAHLRATGKRRPLEDVLGNFDEELLRYQLSDDDFDKLQKRGAQTLTTFLEARYDSFTPDQQVEYSFATEEIKLGDACITGAIDLIDIDEETKTIKVTDYKTGKPSHSWKGRADYEKIKLHHYRQQLLIYKLLIENSRQFAGYRVTSGIIEFVEPDAGGNIQRLELDCDGLDEEINQLILLIQGVWKRIMNLDFGTQQAYSTNLDGIIAFEDDIRNS